MSRWQFILQSMVLFVVAGTALGAGVALVNGLQATTGALIGGGVSGVIAAAVLFVAGVGAPASELNEELVRPRPRKPDQLEEI